MAQGVEHPIEEHARDLRRALAWLREGRADLALSRLQELEAAQPGDLLVSMSAAAARLRLGETVTALETFNRLLCAHPAHTGALHGRGLCLHRLGSRTEALDAFRKVVSLDPLNWRAWQSIADITHDEDDRVHALEGAADALIVLCAAEAPGTNLLLEAVRALLDARRPGAAVRLLQAHRQGDSPSRPRPQRLAQALYHKGDFQAAFREARRAFALCGEAAAAARPGFQPEAATRALIKLTAILEAGGLRPFLAAGTLLGLCRNGGPLRHDRDVDIGILRDAEGGPDLAGILRACRDILMPRRARPGDRYFQVYLDGICIDIFLYDAAAGARICGFGNIPGDIQWRFNAFGLEARVYGGRQWWVPAAPERYLSESYGPDWQRPDRHFASALSSPALYGVDAHVRGCYALWRAERALQAGDRCKAAALLRQSSLTAGLAGNLDAGALKKSSGTGPPGEILPLPDLSVVMYFETEGCLT